MFPIHSTVEVISLPFPGLPQQEICKIREYFNFNLIKFNTFTPSLPGTTNCSTAEHSNPSWPLLGIT